MARVDIPRRRSLALFAVLAVVMVVFSYALILALAWACLYLPFQLVWAAPNVYTFGLVLSGVILAASMLWSIVPRRMKFVPPGLLLERTEHPRLFAEIDNIAAGLGEPVPSEVYLIGAPNAFVNRRGGFLGANSRRVMALGLPLVAAMNVSELRAILAHEFAHYYGGDTRLGPWVFGAQTVIARALQNMGAVAHTARFGTMQFLYLIVFNVLKHYWLLFLRAIKFISRRQEFRADELACIIAEPQSFISGLRILHAATITWAVYWETEVSPLLGAGLLPPIANGFCQFLAAPEVAKQLEPAVEKEIRDGKTTPYDSHPSLRERIAAAQKLPAPVHSQNVDPALTLLGDIDITELGFLLSLKADLETEGFKRVTWQEQPTILLNEWRALVNQYLRLLEGLTIAGLSFAGLTISEIAPRIRDPKGMLLTRQQRAERACSLVAIAFALRLIERGWALHSSPGELYLEREGRRIQPFILIRQVCSGAISKQDWRAQCEELGVVDLPLVTAAAEAHA